MKIVIISIQLHTVYVRDGSWSSSVSIVISLWAERLGFNSHQGRQVIFFLFAIASRLALGLTQPPIQWVPEARSLGIRRPVCEADHSCSSSAEIKNAWSYTSIPSTRLRGVVRS
jgi:hypothetical protein